MSLFEMIKLRCLEANIFIGGKSTLETAPIRRYYGVLL